MTTGIEPFTTKQVADWITAQGAHFIRQTGSHCFWATKDGLRVSVPDHNKKAEVPTLLAKEIASRFGLTLRDFRAEFGVSAGKRRATTKQAQTMKRPGPRPTTPPPPPPPSVVESLRALADEVDVFYRSGRARAGANMAVRRELARVPNIVNNLRHQAEQGA